MKTKTKLLSLLVLGFGAFAAQASEINITSTEPDTKVYDVTAGDAQRKELAVTPAKFQDKDLGEGKIFLIQKPGFAPVYVPMMGEFKKDVNLNIKLKKISDWTSEDTQKHSIEVAEEIVDRVLTIQNLLDARKISEALPLAEVLKDAYPNSVYVKLVYANALFMSGNVSKADTLYGLLLSELPPHRGFMRESIENVRATMRGGRAVASKPASAKKKEKK